MILCLAFLTLAASVGQASNEPLPRILDRLAASIRQFEQDFAIVLSDEQYDQKDVVHAGGVRSSTTRIRSEMMFAWVPESQSWLTVRNVLAVNGRPVPDSKDRLDAALADEGPDRMRRFRRLRDEGARFNIGSIYRNFNDPTLVLQFLDPINQPRFVFSLVGTQRVNGVDAWKLAFAERARPTVIQNPTTGDLVSNGLLWISRSDGAVARTSLTVTDPATNVRADTVVDYRRDSKVGMWVPARMNETYVRLAFVNRAPAGTPSRIGPMDERIEGVATYSNFRRFETSARLVAPK